MASVSDTVDLDDPCALVPVLRKIRLELVTGKASARARFGTDEREFVKADLPRLDRLIEDAERACALRSGTAVARRRRAIRAGF